MKLPKRLSYLHQVIMQVFVCILLSFFMFLIGHFLYGLLNTVVPDNRLVPIDFPLGSTSVTPIEAIAISFFIAIIFLLSIRAMLGYVKNIFNLIKLIINPDLDIDNL